MKKGLIFILSLVLVLSVIGCSPKEGNKAATDVNKDRTIKVGFPAPLSGSSAGWGSDMEKGITLAIDELNANGGIDGHKFELVKGDVKGQEPSTVTTEVKRLIHKEKVDIMVTGAANPSLVELSLMQKNEMPYILYGYAMSMERVVPKNPDNYSYIHNAIPSYARYQTEFPSLVDQWVKDGKFKPLNKKVAVIKSQNAYSLYCGDGMKETFKKMGWDVVVDETIPYERYTEYAPILSKIRQEKPSIIMYTDHQSANAATFLKSFLEDPTPSLVFLQATPSYPEFQKIMDGQQKGVIWDYAASLLGNNATEFNKKYEDKWGEKPNPYGAFVYDAMMMAADAMKKSGKPFDKKAVNDVLNSPNYSYKGYVGTYKFDPKTHLALSGENGIPFVNYQEWDGHVVISPKKYAEGEFRLPPWYEKAMEKYGK